MKKIVISSQKYITQIGLGCVTFGREIDALTSFDIMSYALEKGITLFDTAAAYSGGISEKIIGEWLVSKGDDAGHIVIATKILPPFDKNSLSVSVDQSIGRLKRKYIDILFLHSWHASLEDLCVLEELNALLTSGRVRALGASNFNSTQLNAILEKQINNKLIPIAFLQNNQNIAVSDIDDPLRQICKQHSIRIITYSPLGAGFLTGKYKSVVQPDVRFELIPEHKNIYFNEYAWQRFEKLLEVSGNNGRPVAELALAWALNQTQVKSVLIGCRSIQHIDQALTALNCDIKALLIALEDKM
ncbi:aldo/keto reductase [Agriterribacter sp.]|uniref:aldo/keto reductase n=1 Tax=Agriterribacter sp. TaxID=2821509 RepID=UPI002BF4B942|nr:aldo/keto reductase [Agriterribacter sp.]HRO46530.1 aldo/keto reductase [Agriterribacter sp.]HRQ17541.1 aldo/keto reductase [Agriterribacter sp.]